MRLALAALLFLLAGVRLAPADETVPAAVGRVLVDGGGPCSGVLVGPRTLLTVGHCVAARDPWRPHAARRLAVELAGARLAVAEVRLADASPFDADGALVHVARDWAVLELVSTPAVEPLAFRGPDGLRRAYILGIALRKVGWAGGGLRVDPACRLVDVAGNLRLAAFRCGGDAGRGRSGSALLAGRGAGTEVVGVQSAESRGAFGTVGLLVSPEP